MGYISKPFLFFLCLMVFFVFNVLCYFTSLFLCLSVVMIHGIYFMILLSYWLTCILYPYLSALFSLLLLYSFPNGWITLPMNRGIAVFSLQMMNTKGCMALKVLKERENERLLAAAASTPCSVSERNTR